MKPVIDRFLSKIKINDDSGCWEWTGSKSIKGYGDININNHPTRIHRFIYEYYHGTICPDLQINHKCRNKCCCNPLHLEQVSAQQNNDYSRNEYLLGLKNRIHHNTKKTHCKHGHEFNENNTYYSINQNNRRHCKTCKKNGIIKKGNLV